MPKITLYMDDDTLVRARAAAEQAGLSTNDWLTRLISEHTKDAWPKELTQLSGAWADFPSLDDIRSGQGEDGERETL